MEKVKKIKRKESKGLREFTVKVNFLNWVGARKTKGRPMSERTLKGVLSFYNSRVVLFDGTTHWFVRFLEGGEVEFTPIKNVDLLQPLSLKGWYNVAEKIGRQKISVYNVARSLREVFGKKIGKDPHRLKVLIDWKE